MSKPISLEPSKSFRAKLRPPKPTLWLGVTVDRIEPSITRQGGAFMRVWFKEMPYMAIWAASHQRAFEKMMEQEQPMDMDAIITLFTGAKCHVLVEFMEMKDFNGPGSYVVPRARIQINSLELIIQD